MKFSNDDVEQYHAITEFIELKLIEKEDEEEMMNEDEVHY